MNADLKKMIEICKRDDIQELIREVWPDRFMGYYIWIADEGKYKILLPLDTIKTDLDSRILLPFGLDEERACSQIDTLLMEALKNQFDRHGINYNGIIDFDILENQFWFWNEYVFNCRYFNKPDLYLKLVWLEELLEAQNDTEV